MTTYVSVYEVYRRYGGPEEGGWYYDEGYLVYESSFASAEDAVTEAEWLRTAYPETGRYTSVAYSGGDYRVRVSRTPGNDYPAERPRYE
jgi:hypothetical protein